MTDEALKAWAGRGLHEVTLPSGVEVRIRIPEADVLIRRNLLPDTLLGVASRFVTTGVDLDKATDQERIEFDLMVRHLVASSVRAVRSGDTWEDVTLTVQQLDELELPPDDLRALEMIARRMSTPALITAASRLGVTGDQDLADAVLAATTSEEAAATVTGWSSFRGEPAGAHDRADGGAVRAVAGGDLPGDPGSGPRGGRRRGARPAVGRR